jgi:hypothetical protein
MDITNKVDKIIENKKWIKNYIGMGKFQCAKVVKDEKELLILIVSDKSDTPISTRVEKILAVSDEVILFYDGQYAQKIEKDEFHRYRNFLSEEEWNIILRKDAVEKLVSNNMVSEEEGFYIELHETIETYMNNGYDKQLSDMISTKYNLKNQ